MRVNFKGNRDRLIAIVLLLIVLITFIFGFSAIEDTLYNIWPSNLGAYANINLPRLSAQFLEVALISAFISAVLGFLIGLFVFTPFGESFRVPLDKLSSVLFAVPSIAIIMISFNIIGTGKWTGIAAIVVQGVLPVIISTYSGISSISPQYLEVAAGLGMTATHTLIKVQLPLASPIIISGIRVSLIMCISTATLAYQAGAGGLGQLIFTGFATYDFVSVFAGTLVICLIAVIADQLLRYFENSITIPNER